MAAASADETQHWPGGQKKDGLRPASVSALKPTSRLESNSAARP